MKTKQLAARRLERLNRALLTGSKGRDQAQRPFKESEVVHSNIAVQKVAFVAVGEASQKYSSD